MSKRVNKKWPKPEEVAAKHKPNWEPLVVSDGPGRPPARPDEVSPELEDLRRKFLGANAKRVPLPADLEPTAMVSMVPKARTDGPSPGAKRVIVKGKRVIGEQG